ncbi:MAG: hypothetical protein JWQ36_2606, partial [Enterovirga sp.]|nr:hypothetical protein [Enterovirga sp.]
MSFVIFGFGYTAAVFADRARARFGRIVATARSPEKVQQITRA